MKHLYKFPGVIIFLCNLVLLACGGGQKSAKAVNEQIYISLGGEKQYVEIMGTDAGNPVLLFLHGGPGWPQTPHLRYFNSALTKNITVVAWEQAGCGKSYMQNSNPKSVSLEQFINDGHQLTQILKQKFGKSKIYLAGFSWGSVIGLNLANRYPDDYVAYIGISQVIDLRQSIELSRAWIKEQATGKHDTAMLKKVALLEKQDTGFCKDDLDCFFKKYEMLTEYNGAIHNKNSEAEIKIAESKYDDYKQYDWLNAFMFSAGKLGTELFKTNLANIKTLKLPVYFMAGRHDHSLPPAVTQSYVEQLTAPHKEIIWFENSGHEPLEEEAALFNKRMVGLVN